MCLERATIADRQGASEDQKFVAQPTQSNMNLFITIGINCAQSSALSFALIKNQRQNLQEELKKLSLQALGSKMFLCSNGKECRWRKTNRCPFAHHEPTAHYAKKLFALRQKPFLRELKILGQLKKTAEACAHWVLV